MAEFGCVAAAQLDILQPVPGNVTLPQDKGRVMGCVVGRKMTPAALAAEPTVNGEGITPLGGAAEYVVQYISEGPRGTPRRVTAYFTVPTDTPGPFPLVSFGHGTTGLAPGCGITSINTFVDYIRYPLAAKGYASVATDYQNLGVADGVHPYAVGQGEADNLLDAIRAAHALNQVAGGNVLTDEVFLLGHSQGGHAALFAHQFYDVQNTRLLGSVAVAPAFGIFYGLTQTVSVPTAATNQFTGFYMMILYGHAAYWGIPLADWLTPDAAQRIPTLAQTQCSSDFINSVDTQWATNADVFTPAFMSAAATCQFDGAACPGFQPWADRLYASVPGYFTSDVPVLMLYGGQDTIVSSLSMACIQAGLRLSNTHVDTCYYPSEDHITVGLLPFQDALNWMAQRRSGTMTPQVCTTPFTQTCPGL